MISKKTIVALTIAGVLGVSSVAGAGTYAYFTSQATSTNNTIQAGTLTLENGSASTIMTLSEMAPGDEEKGKEALIFSVDNSGTLKAILDAEVTASAWIDTDKDKTKDDGEEILGTDNILMVKPSLSGDVEENNDNYISINGLQAWLNEKLKNKEIEAETGNITLKLDAMLDGHNTGNEYQDASFNVDITINASQIQTAKYKLEEQKFKTVYMGRERYIQSDIEYYKNEENLKVIKLQNPEPINNLIDSSNNDMIFTQKESGSEIYICNYNLGNFTIREEKKSIIFKGEDYQIIYQNPNEHFSTWIK